MDGARSRKEITHERIVDTAARAIRRAGFQGMGVADIMKEVGLTHGGFYAHFESRDALLAEALDHAGRASGSSLAKAVSNSSRQDFSALKVLVECYLSEEHLGSSENGCPVAALVSEVPRQSAAVRDVGSERVWGILRLVKSALPSSTPIAEASAIASQLIGAVQLARALGDKAEGKKFLAAIRSNILALHGRARP